MELKEAYLERVVGKVEDLAARIHLLKARFAEQKVSVKLEHYWELANVRSLFTEFKWRIEQLEVDDDLQLRRDQQVIESTWHDLMQAVDSLLAVLAERRKGMSQEQPALGSSTTMGVGLRGMRERAGQLGGTFQILS